MATSRDFNAMLNEYLPDELLKETLIKRTWILENIKLDNKWHGGNYIVPFRGARGTSVKHGALEAQGSIAKFQYVRGSVTAYKEMWGSLRFEQRDLIDHQTGRIPEDTFLRVLPQQIDEFMGYFKEVLSLQLLNGLAVAKFSADGDATGIIAVDRVERFEIGQKVQVLDDDTAAVDAFVTAINMNTNELTLEDAASGGAAVDLSALTTAQNARLIWDNVGAAGNGFVDLKRSLLSAANSSGGVSGTAALYGVTKTAWPYTQAINISGAAITAANIVEKIFDAYTDVKNKGKGNPSVALMSYKNFGSVLKATESGKGAYHQNQTSMKVSHYGWTEVDITGTKGALKVVAIQEIDDDWIGLLDTSSMTFASNGMIRKRRNPEGHLYYEVRDTTGYFYIVDVFVFGEFILHRVRMITFQSKNF